MSKSFTVEEVARHNTEKDCWVVIHGGVYDVTNFLSEHPGGKKILLKAAGQDASAQFDKFHDVTKVLKQYEDLKIGTIGTGTAAAESSSAGSPAIIDDEEMGLFGDMVPYGDPAWYQGHKSPYYNETHRKVRKAVRHWVETELKPYVDEWDEAKKLPKSIFKSAAEAGILSAIVCSGWKDSGVPEWLGDAVKLPGGVSVDDFDAFSFLVACDEICRCGSGGVFWGLLGGLGIGLPPVMKFASEELQKKVVADCLRGDKNICLAITEPAAGSDVANLTTTAVKSADGKHYILNGEKKWITNGVFADYFTVACRTGKAGFGGLSLLLVSREFAGVSTRQMNCMGVWSSGTTFITFDDVKVPVENLIGEENKGFQYIMYNFNYERFGLCVSAARFSRVLYEEAFKYANKRKTFGKKLIEHQVIRHKLAEMARQIEAYWAQIEHICFQLNEMDSQEGFFKLGGPTALCKVQGSKLFEFCAREAAQIFGGLSYSRGGQGGKVERLYREVRAWAIPGGSEEIMLELGIRQQQKVSEKMQTLLAGM
uniref:Cytochrome b5 heme-binding domain-containing protein n=1 Tax=Chromera velia CCMP2878 TaxID=1169474 RepID=A0A0G4IBZ9_9ALVE|eukprot:Cvel_12992.t1-p1 / transcript=Cvel_12992.t1 / gene=Cvel_12992 / organism=Chromera_velia_CCMP2878 / gene_product=Long-chain specific acyl-CoA dehydrogenase,, putative / transcript_product=Long-chain specific acyl-CoA dehydrogenase,, putative / location=Cvel_scaffold871:14380-19209(-) / protein_length=538 / sequence_SO=supercontig / SO=protein_coding / is_pseudo=false